MEPDLKLLGGPLLGWAADDPRWPKLEHYLSRVREAGVPLASRRDRERLVERHLIPSLESLAFIAESGQLLDFGSGGGFPALPLAFARPHLSVLCIESNSRKAAFLRRVSRETGLANVQVIESRVEDIEATHDRTIDFLTARAVADFPKLLAQTARFLTSRGCWILWKGQNWRREGDLGKSGARLIEERSLSNGSRLLVLVPVEPEKLP
ncbi:MAG: 16S rRNA (guanine(527)-N(7))-methyltransferase RsmG [bacterium]|nr:16S rRNA (guanine(527)-N(7))-methyltransferase RsmG [bacterium]